MQLIHALAGGIRGAENGTVEVYERGTSTPATLYADFEGTTSIAAVDDDGRPLLNERGAVNIYHNGIVRVVVNDALGTTIATFTCGNQASAEEYQGPSFTGIDYETASEDTNEPTTVKRVLDRWLSNGGAPDWKVYDSAGEPVSMGSVGTLLGLIFNVKDPVYGATGDSTTNDRAAIQSALDAADNAGGGVVYFPAGTYRITDSLSVVNKVALLGAGCSAVTISLDSAPDTNEVVNFYGGDAAGEAFDAVQGIAFVCAQDCTVPMLSLHSRAARRIEHCDIGGEATKGTAVACEDYTARALLVDCRLQAGSASTAGLIQGAAGKVRCLNCTFSVWPGGYYGPADGMIAGYQLDLESCYFDISGQSGGLLRCILPPADAAVNVRIVGCEFAPHTAEDGSAIAMEFGVYHEDSVIHENANTFGDAVQAYSYTATNAAKVVLGSRAQRAIAIEVTGSGTKVVPLDQYGVIVYTADNEDMGFEGYAPPVGAATTIIVYNNGAEAFDLSALSFDAISEPIGGGAHWELNASEIIGIVGQFDAVATYWVTGYAAGFVRTFLTALSPVPAGAKVPSEAIPLFANQASGYEELAGAQPLAMNVVVDGAGAVRRRPGIAEHPVMLDSIIDARGLEAVYVTEAGRLFMLGAPNPVTHVANAYRVNNLGGLDTLGSYTRLSRATIAETEAILAIATGSLMRKIDLATDTLSLLGGTPPVASHVVFNNLRLLANDVAVDRTKVRYSDVQQGLSYAGHEQWTAGVGITSVAGFFTAEASSDPVVALHENTNEVLVFGSRTLQVYGPDSTVVNGVAQIRAPLQTMESGLAAPYAVAKRDDEYYWLDHMRRVVRSSGRGAEPISQAIHRDLQGLGTVSDCIAMRVLQGPVDGVLFMFPTDGRSFFYQHDVGWGQWSGWDDGVNNWAPLAIRCLHFDRAASQNLVGLSTGLLGVLDQDTSTDLGDRINAVIRTGFIDRNVGARKVCTAIHLTFRRSDSAVFAEARGTLRWRDSLGPWEAEIPIAVDPREPVVTLRSLGTYRRRQWEYQFDGPEALVLVSASEDFYITD